ncbi:recombination protein NinG [Pseudomonas palleroniana]|uniref:recombination protein NinG n=1 Tax=Pseudomonas palleroniana TaxID=191390 RepID=UPI0018E6B2F5|nr:recombination protein NinG [Pseudomonas palleroniana]MBI6911065.1 recombination protein NinG [Pseudomonas palleroniana]
MIAKQPKPKPKTCKNPACRASFVPRVSFQSWCSPDCAVVIARRKQEKQRKSFAQRERREIKVRKEKLKTRGDHMREAQQAFNAYIRARDQAAGHLCISSGKPLDWSGNAVDAGHYRSVGSAPHLRFDERNCHAQSKQDNRFLSGNAVDYRIGLIARIGQEAVDSLEADQSPRKHTVEDLKAIKAKYRAMTRELKKRQAA